MHLFIQLDHPVPEALHRHEPGRNRLVDQRCPGAIAERVAVGDPSRMNQLAAGLEKVDQGGVGLLDVHSRDVGHLVGEVSASIDRVDQDGNAGVLKGVEVDFAIGGRHVDKSGSFVLHNVGRDDPECSLVPLLTEVIEGRLVADAEHLRSLGRREDRRGFSKHGRHLLGCDPVVGAVVADTDVIDVRPDGDGEVAGKSPGCGRPDQEKVADFDRAPRVDNLGAHSDRRILDVAVVHVGFEVGKRCGRPPGVGENLEVAIDEPFIP